MLGKVAKLKTGYGFIDGDDGVSHFFLPSHLQKTVDYGYNDLKEGDAVEFTPVSNPPKGMRAIEIRKVS